MPAGKKPFHKPPAADRPAGPPRRPSKPAGPGRGDDRPPREPSRPRGEERRFDRGGAAHGARAEGPHPDRRDDPRTGDGRGPRFGKGGPRFGKGGPRFGKEAPAPREERSFRPPREEAEGPRGRPRRPDAEARPWRPERPSGGPPRPPRPERGPGAPPRRPPDRSARPADRAGRPAPTPAAPRKPPKAPILESIETVRPRPKTTPQPATEGGPPALPIQHSVIRYARVVEVGETIELAPETLSTLAFRQVNVKEAFTFADADGRFFRASLTRAGDKGGEAVVYEAIPEPPESPLRLSLFCAVLARQRMIFVSQKATELGIERLQPLLTERSVPEDGLEHEKAHAWPGQAIRAAKQCRRGSIPEVRPALPLAEALATDLWRGAEARFYLDNGAPAAVTLERGPASACLAVGPEGGWTDAEREQLAAAGATPLVLGSRVLRAETAVVAGLALLQHHLGDLLVEE